MIPAKIVRFILLICAIMLIRLLLPGRLDTAYSAEPVILGYYPGGIRETLPADSIDFSILTHICHAFARANADGTVDYGDNFLYPGLNDAVHKAGRKILISLGGGGGGRAENGFPPMAANPETRAKFIRNLLEFCSVNHYDGVDLDWEFPRNEAEKKNHALLLAELRRESGKIGGEFLITVASSALQNSDRQLDYESLKETLDWFNVMTYDFHGPWTAIAGHNAPLYSIVPGRTGIPESCHNSILFLTEKMGIPREKLVLGLAFYGREFDAPHYYGPGSGGEGLGYRDIVLQFARGGWKYNWDDVAMAPYLANRENTKVLTYDDPESIALKCRYATRMRLRGVMIWRIGHDLLEGEQPLLHAVGEGMKH